jgi:hypothetical protein
MKVEHRLGKGVRKFLFPELYLKEDFDIPEEGTILKRLEKVPDSMYLIATNADNLYQFKGCTIIRVGDIKEELSKLLKEEE